MKVERLKGEKVDGMSKTLKTGIAGLLVAFACSLGAAAATNTLTYAATFGRFVNGVVERYPLTNAVEMTLTLYGSDATAATALWSRRVTADVVDGDFAVELSDRVGTDDLSRNVAYASLERLLSSVPADSAFWVEVSNVTCGGEPLPEAVTDALQRGKITGVPFAVTVEKAVSARGSFTVNGRATITVLKTTGNAVFEGTTTFEGATSFDRETVFASDMTVTGAVSRTTLDGIGTLSTPHALIVSQDVTANLLTVTGGVATTLTPAGDLPRLGMLSVADTLSAPQGVTAGLVDTTNETLLGAGDVTLAANGTIVWDADGKLSISNGVYEADNENSNATSIWHKETSSSGNSYVWTNEGSRNCLVSATTGAGTVRDAITVGGKVWAYANAASNTVTLLAPVKAGDSFTADWGVATRTHKELSK